MTYIHVKPIFHASADDMVDQVLGKIPPGKMPSGEMPPGKVPPGDKPPRKIAPTPSP